MHILFCSDPLAIKKVDIDWQIEYEMAKQHGMQVSLLDYDSYKTTASLNAIRLSEKPGSVTEIIYRGWMMPVSLYEKLYTDLLSVNLRLINSPEQYQHCYYLPDSYDLIKDKTPLSVIFPGKNLPDDDIFTAQLAVFGEKSIIVKDYVKSQKHYWNEACFIPNANDLENVKKIVSTFLEKQGDSFQGGLVFREFVEFEPIGTHARSQMPLTKEYRLFILHGQVIACGEYWDEGNYNQLEAINLTDFHCVFETIKSKFFTVDIARKKEGTWMIMELGDAQVAEFLDSTGLNDFYSALKNS